MPSRGAKRDAILAAGARLLGRGTFSVEGLLAEAGAGVGTFYHHFPNGRDDLLAALEAQAAGDYEAAVMRVLQRNRDAETGVKALVHHHARWAAEQPQLTSLLPARPGPELLRAARAWTRAVGLEGVSAEELLAVALAPVRVVSSAERMAAAAWAAVRELATG